jgi:hypothetical protein
MVISLLFFCSPFFSVNFSARFTLDTKAIISIEQASIKDLSCLVVFRLKWNLEISAFSLSFSIWVLLEQTSSYFAPNLLLGFAS